MSSCVLITGGAGFIGSHTYAALRSAGIDAVIMDNFATSKRRVFDALQLITGSCPRFVEGDICDRSSLENILTTNKISAVMHLAGLKAARDSTYSSSQYHVNNVIGTDNLLAAMKRANVKTLVFASSAAVYASSSRKPIDESFPCSGLSPYAVTKLTTENSLAGLYATDPNWKIARLRYFNPAGAHESGLIGDDPLGRPSGLVPSIALVAAGKSRWVEIYGADYDTEDGTAVRDYTHIQDIAEANVAALKHLEAQGGLITVNIGTGRGASVLQMIHTFEKITGTTVPYVISAPRANDVDECFAEPLTAEKKFGWVARRSLDQICRDTWRWRCMNPYLI